MSHSLSEERAKLKQIGLDRNYGTTEKEADRGVHRLKLSFIKKENRTSSFQIKETSLSALAHEIEEKKDKLKAKQEYESYHIWLNLSRKANKKKEDLFRGQLTVEEDAVDDTDIEGDELAKNEWELRELERLERDLTAGTINADENIESITSDSSSEKTKYSFLQKYYHKGAFYADESDPIFQRDYNLPTEQDAVDKSALPEILQVRNYGKRSRSKWKHLSAEDTTAFDGYGWYQKDAFASIMASKMAGQDQSKK